MSSVRGVVPLLVATTVGIASGVWVFGPAFKEEQEKKQQAKLMSAQNESGAVDEVQQIPGVRGAVDSQAPDVLSSPGNSQKST